MVGAGSTSIGVLVLIFYHLSKISKKVEKTDNIPVLMKQMDWVQNKISDLQIDLSHRKREIIACHKRVDKLTDTKEINDG